MKRAAAFRRRILYAALALGSLPPLHPAFADAPLALKQLEDGGPIEPIGADLASLGDRFFEIVLARHADVTNLAQIEALLQPDASKRETFVVHEDIANPAPGQSRRSVLVFRGTNAATGAILQPNVALSVFFSSDSFSDEPAVIEAWGWDADRFRYNYYKLDRSGFLNRTLSWKFRGSSIGADLRSDEERAGTCFQCHVNGAPIMKEFSFPWNNWHSFKSPANYLQDSWPVRTSPRLSNGALKSAEILETEFIRDAIANFNDTRITAALRRGADGELQRDAAGNVELFEARRVLKPLFVTTEVNFISSGQLSGMHRFPGGGSGRPSGPIGVPSTFFLNANLIAGGGPTGYLGFGSSDAREFEQKVRVEPAEYRALVDDRQLRLGGARSDANFAWFVPEPSHVDNSMVDRLLRRGAVTPHFAAAVLAIDLERPIFSSRRAELLRFVPARYAFHPTSNGPASEPHPLTTAVVAALRAEELEPGSPAHELLSLLESTDAVAELKVRVREYLSRVQRLLATSETRQAELERLMDRAIEVRRRVRDDPLLGLLDEETGHRLLPLP